MSERSSPGESDGGSAWESNPACPLIAGSDRF
jgi:hypothetical protein